MNGNVTVTGDLTYVRETLIGNETSQGSLTVTNNLTVDQTPH